MAADVNIQFSHNFGVSHRSLMNEINEKCSRISTVLMVSYYLLLFPVSYLFFGAERALCHACMCVFVPVDIADIMRLFFDSFYKDMMPCHDAYCTDVKISIP